MKEKIKNKGVLYVVATPIGNLQDITLRAIDVLKMVDLVACEDTRVTGRLLFGLGIKKHLFSFHQHSKEFKITDLINKLDRGTNIALVTDSGTPGISDPGAKLVKRVLDYGKIKVVSIPGPSALSAALSISGAPSKKILFLGFLPNKKGRKTRFEEIKEFWERGMTIVFFESPHRIKRTVRELSSYTKNAELSLFREITKKFEETITIRLNGSEEEINKIRAQGEFTAIIRPKR
ncbi:MAG: 16S rRNA (cytidine(1402)-2'-O)-methyltransferase, partial [Candidatus Berkelbacteria bacterium]|nr:16S rRNA (cytidine(1402)-2'-O)-methyltransferase [Candidatus Berkelbacteria bacterium]